MKDVEGYDVLVAALLNQVILRTQLVKMHLQNIRFLGYLLF